MTLPMLDNSEVFITGSTDDTILWTIDGPIKRKRFLKSELYAW